jgi:hypothetical protein
VQICLYTKLSALSIDLSLFGYCFEVWVYFGSQQNLPLLGICDESDLCVECDSLTGHAVNLARITVHCMRVCMCMSVCVCVCVGVVFFFFFNRLNPCG